MTAMRALTIKQPYAQLVAAGVVGVRLSDVDTDYRGPVAIHAAAVPMTMADLKADCERDDQLWMLCVALSFDEQELLDCLPRGAIVGIVDLADVVPVTEPGGFMPRLGEATPGEFVYVFGDAEEIVPIEGVRGKRDLWELDSDLEDAVLGAEPAASIADINRVQFDTASPEFQLEFMYRLARRDDPAQWRMKEPWLEAKVSRYIAEHVAQFADPTGRSRVRTDPGNAAQQRLFGDAEWVPRKRFERKVRRLIAMQHEDRDPQTITGDGPEDIVRLLEFVTAEMDRAKVEGRMDELEGLAQEGDGELLQD